MKKNAPNEMIFLEERSHMWNDFYLNIQRDIFAFSLFHLIDSTFVKVKQVLLLVYVLKKS